MIETQETWNMAKAYLQRLDNIMQEANFFSKHYDCRNWFMGLLSQFRELSPKIKGKLKDGEMTKHEEQIQIIKKKLNQSIVKSIMFQTSPDYSAVYEEVHKWDMMIKESMEKLNLITPPAEDPRWAMANR